MTKWRVYTLLKTVESEGRTTTLLNEFENLKSSVGVHGTRWIVRVKCSDGSEIFFPVAARDWCRLRAIQPNRGIRERYPK